MLAPHASLPPAQSANVAAAAAAMIVALCVVHWRALLRIAAIVAIFLALFGLVVVVDGLRQAGI